MTKTKSLGTGVAQFVKLSYIGTAQSKPSPVKLFVETDTFSDL